VIDGWFIFVGAVVYTAGWYFKGRFDGAEAVRRQNRTLNESRKKG
jgi:hypothetical protein